MNASENPMETGTTSEFPDWERIDTGPLSWVMSELREALERSVESLRQFGHNLDDASALRMARSHLHAAHGALQIVDLEGVSLITEEVEHLFERFAESPQSCTADAIETVAVAFRSVTEYLEELLSHAPHQPVRLFPAYRALLALRQAERIHPADLFYPDLSVRPPRATKEGHTLSAAEIAEQRARFEKALLQYLRDDTNRAATEQMRSAVSIIEASPKQGQQRAFWWVTKAFFDALADDTVPADLNVKRLCARINLQIRRLLEGTGTVAERLLRDTLFFVARSNSTSSHVLEVKRVYQLDHSLPDDFEEDRYGRIDFAMLRSAKDALVSAKTAWGRVVAGEVAQIPGFARDASSLLGSTGSLGRSGLAQVAQVVASIGTELSFDPRKPSEAVGLDVATALLFLEGALEQVRSLDDTFDDRARAVVARVESSANGHHSDEHMPWLDEISRQAQERLTMASFVAEMQSNLRNIEKILDAFFRDTTNNAELPQAEKLLGQIGGALSVMGHEQAGQAVATGRASIREFMAESYKPDAAEFERVAQSLGAVGFYVENLQHRSDAGTKFSFDSATGLFSADLTGGSESKQAASEEPDPDPEQLGPADEAVPSGPEPSIPEVSLEQEIGRRGDAASQLIESLTAHPNDLGMRQELEEALHRVSQDAVLLDDAQLKQKANTALKALHDGEGSAVSEHLSESVADLVSQASKVAGGASQPSVDLPAVSAPIPSAATSIDAELLEVFLMEAEEVLETAGTALTELQSQPASREQLTTMRRSFHTLKGSGRMVGLNAFGEAAWGIEQTLNVWLAEAKSATQNLIQLVTVASSELGAWVVELKETGHSARSPEALIAAADAVREGGPFVWPPVLATAVETTAPTVAPESPHEVAHAPVAAEVPHIAAPAQEPPTIFEAEAPGVAAVLADAAQMPFVSDVPVRDIHTSAIADEDLQKTVVMPDEPDEEEAAEAGDMGFEFDPSLARTEPIAPVTAAGSAHAAQEEEPDWSKTEIMSFASDEPEVHAPVKPVAEDVDFAWSAKTEILPDMDDPPDSSGEASVDFDLNASHEPDLVFAAPVAPFVPPAPVLEPVHTEPTVHATDSPSANESTSGGVDYDFDIAPIEKPPEATILPFIAPGSARSDEVRNIGTLTLSVPLYNLYLAEADELLRSLSHDFGEWRHELHRNVSEVAVRSAHSLAGTSATIGLTSVHDVAYALELVLQTLSRRPAPVTLSEIATMQGAVECLRAMLHRFAAEILPPSEESLIGELSALRDALRARHDQLNLGAETTTSWMDSVDILDDRPSASSYNIASYSAEPPPLATSPVSAPLPRPSDGDVPTHEPTPEASAQSLVVDESAHAGTPIAELEAEAGTAAMVAFAATEVMPAYETTPGALDVQPSQLHQESGGVIEHASEAPFEFAIATESTPGALAEGSPEESAPTSVVDAPVEAPLESVGPSGLSAFAHEVASEPLAEQDVSAEPVTLHELEPEAAGLLEVHEAVDVVAPMESQEPVLAPTYANHDATIAEAPSEAEHPVEHEAIAVALDAPMESQESVPAPTYANHDATIVEAPSEVEHPVENEAIAVALDAPTPTVLTEPAEPSGTVAMLDHLGHESVEVETHAEPEPAFVPPTASEIIEVPVAASEPVADVGAETAAHRGLSDEAKQIQSWLEESGGAAQAALYATPAPAVAAPIRSTVTAPNERRSLAREVSDDAQIGHQVRDEIDPELIEIFLQEAGEYLPQIGENLRLWQGDATNMSYPQALLRQLHTVKGSARMAGAMRLGELVHDMETRVESGVTLREIPQGLFDELVTAQDRSLELYDALMHPEAHRAPEATPVGNRSTIVEVADKATDSAVGTSASQPSAISAEAAPFARVPVVPAAGVTPGTAGAFVARGAGAATPAQPQVVQAVRVRADVLDRLVNQAGEVSISRSRLENEVGQIKNSLGDLTENLSRLRGQLREIEIQAETQMQSQFSLAKERERFDPLEFDRFTRLQELTRMMAESVNDVATVQQNLMRSLDGANRDLTSQQRMTRDLQQDLMRVRMVPFGSVSERLYRVVRQTAKELDKRVNLDIRGGSVEIDRSVLERMVAPFEHLLRNAIVHGIESRAERSATGKSETGELMVEVRQEGNEIVLTFSDDGAGLNLPRIRELARTAGMIAHDEDVNDSRAADLIFQPGFTTVTEVTELAGRGVGMDVVRAEAGGLGGRVAVDSTANKGTRFTINLPLTLAVTQVVLVNVGGRTYALPSVLVEQVQQLRPQPLAQAYNDGQILWLGQPVKLYFLAGLLGERDRSPIAQRYSPLLILRSGGERIAVHVDEVVGNQEVVVKNIGPQLARMSGISGATVLGSGDIVLILNPVQLAQQVELERLHTVALQENAEIGGAVAELIVEPNDRQARAEPVAGLETLPTIMVVDDSLTVRRVTQRLLVREGYQVVLAKDGVDALQQLQDYTPDVMLVDIEMPRMDGFDLTRNIRGDERYHHIPIVMITSRTADKHRSFALELGVNVYLGKPYQEEELLRHISEFVSEKKRATA